MRGGVNVHHREPTSEGLDWNEATSDIRESFGWARSWIEPVCSLGEGGSSRAHARKQRCKEIKKAVGQTDEGK